MEVLRDFDISPAADRIEFTAVMAAFVFQAEMFPVLVSGRDDLRKGVCLELFVLWRVGVIEGPLLQRYVSVDEGKKPAVLLVKGLIIESKYCIRFMSNTPVGIRLFGD